MENAKVYQLNRDRITANHPTPLVRPPSSAAKPKLLDQVRQTIRTRHYSYIMEKAYVGWIKRFILFDPSTAVLAGYCSTGWVQQAAQAKRSTYIDLISNPKK
jgi:hypothetical protein